MILGTLYIYLMFFAANYNLIYMVAGISAAAIGMFLLAHIPAFRGWRRAKENPVSS